MFTTHEPPTLTSDRSRRSGPRENLSLLDPVVLAGAVWRAKYWIALLAILGAGIGVFVALSTPKVYHASTQLILDPRGLNLVQNEVTETPLGLASDAALALIQSQIAVITSTSVLEQVVDEAGLTQDPEFNGTAEGPFDRYLPSIAFLSSLTPEEEIADRRLLTLVNLRENVWAVRNANSFVVDVAVESQSAEKSSELANLVAATFIAEQARVQAETARSATAALSERLVELRQRVGEAEEAVERYKAENQLVGVGGRLIDDEFILSINQRLAAVRAEITGLNVRAESMRAASVEDIVEGSFPEELASQSLTNLRQIYAEVAQENAVLSSRLGPRHPQRIAGEQALGTARQAIASELTRIVSSAQTELARAQETERDLSAQIETLRGRQIETSGSFVALRDLERDVDASRSIYEAYLLRSREIGEQESLNTANMRIISEASPPFQPSGTSRKLIVAAGGMLGLGLGIALALFFATTRFIRMRLAEAAAPVPAGPTSSFDRPVWTALPPPPRHAETRPRDDADPREEASTQDSAPSPAGEAPAGGAALPPREVADPQATPPPPAARTSEADVRAVDTPDADAAAVEEEPAAPDAAPQSENEIERREKLRRRIREIGTRRRLGAPPLDDAHVSQAIRRLARGDRPSIADIRRRRGDEVDPTSRS